ncbi:fatty acyl-AMP ligase [Actinomadura violacea]|uniref:Fatty acyl-AMP ligase n=1 Tax=Actinomadura violacea TaxID=2819934 RepID=A0ABS3RNL5_9ACTN|nr:fatty acyl-AMP ligase [Actinomadura violacea]MBO2458306.1 fatty acyl-AMP ligase [Actinomadura violacea]
MGEDMAAFQDLVTRFHAHAGKWPERELLTFVRAVREDGELVLRDDRRSRGELDRTARAIAVHLAGRGVAPGDRVLVPGSHGLDFAEAFLGVQYAGAVPVPAPPPGGRREHYGRVAGIARDASVRLVLVDGEGLADTAAWMAQEKVTALGPVTVDEARAGDPEAWRPPRLDPDSLAFLQYTSGSTGRPKGVMVSHGNLAHNLGMLASAMGLHEGSRLGGWLPMFHDMGLIALLLEPMYLGATSTLMAPMQFVKYPHTWLRMIGERGIHMSTAPNFAYDLCLRKVTDEHLAGLDLSGWTHALNGAEPIDARTLDAFSERFAPAGFRRTALSPCYGLAEATLYVSGTPVADPPVEAVVDAAALERHRFEPVAADGVAGATVRLVSSGRVRDLETVIVEPETGTELPDGRVGELWIRGESVARGYWGDPPHGRGTFGAVTASGRGGFLRTGDLAVRVDGCHFITGRVKETIVLNGRNLYPYDVERASRAADPALAGLPSSAFGVAAGTEELVVVQEVRGGERTPGALRELTGAVRAAVAAEFGVRANVVLVRPGRIRRTTSGKIQRGLMRELFTGGSLDPLHEELSPRLADRYRGADPVEAGA